MYYYFFRHSLLLKDSFYQKLKTNEKIIETIDNYLDKFGKKYLKTSLKVPYAS